MILLMHPKFLDIVQCHDNIMQQFAADNHIPVKTPIVFVEDLPEQDDDGNPIFAFSVSAGEYHYWTGKPIKFEVPDER